jgi:hypothetical protein
LARLRSESCAGDIGATQFPTETSTSNSRCQPRRLCYIRAAKLCKQKNRNPFCVASATTSLENREFSKSRGQAAGTRPIGRGLACSSGWVLRGTSNGGALGSRPCCFGRGLGNAGFFQDHMSRPAFSPIRRARPSSAFSGPAKLRSPVGLKIAQRSTASVLLVLTKTRPLAHQK